MSKNDGESTEENASHHAGVSMPCKARFSFHSPHKLLGIAHIYLGLTFKHCHMNLSSWWFEKAIDQTQATISLLYAAGRLVVTLKNKNL